MSVKRLVRNHTATAEATTFKNAIKTLQELYHFQILRGRAQGLDKVDPVDLDAFLHGGTTAPTRGLQALRWISKNAQLQWTLPELRRVKQPKAVGEQQAMLAFVPFGRPAGAQIIDHIGMACAGRTANHGQLHRMRTAVQIRVQTEQPSVEEMNTILRDEATKFFPGKRKQGQIVPWQQHSVGISVKHMWQCYNNWRNNRDSSVQGIFRMWKHYTDFKKAHKAFRKNGKEEKGTG